MKNKISAIVAAIFLCSAVHAVKVETFTYTVRDSALLVDVYFPDDTLSTHPCLIYAFGGGFSTGERNKSDIVAVMNKIAEQGIVCASIDYRLGLKNKKFKNPLEALPLLENAVQIATEDMLSAGAYIYNNAAALKVDKNLIMASGSSAGAIISLQADYYLHSDNPLAAQMPKDFKFAGVLSFAGAVATFGSKVKYTSQPAPTLFIHGTKDNLVPYDKIVIAGKGMYGADYLADMFYRYGWTYEIIRYENFGHEMAWLGIKENVPEIKMFIDRFVLKKGYEARYGAFLDITHREKNIKKPIWQIKGLNLYKDGAQPVMTKDTVQVNRYIGE